MGVRNVGGGGGGPAAADIVPPPPPPLEANVRELGARMVLAPALVP